MIILRILHIIPVICICVCLVVTGCSRDVDSKKTLQVKLKRVVSLSPSITRQIIDLGSEELLAGVTSYHPQLTKKVKIVGTLVKPNIEVITMLRPDIVLLSAEDSAVQITDSLRTMDLNLHIFKRNMDFESICGNYLALAEIIGKRGLALERLEQYRKQRRQLMRKAGDSRVAVFISHEPLITAGGGSFISRIIEDSGGTNVYGTLHSSYPILSVESLVAQNPDAIISMDRDPEVFFNRVLKGFGIKAVGQGHVYYIPAEKISYYTPGDYIASMRSMSLLIERIKKGP